MPTPSAAFAAVAASLGDVDPRDAEAVELFFRRQFPSYSLPVRALISDFLTGLTDMPPVEALGRLKEAIALPESDIPGIDAPVWDEAFGPDMDYLSAEPRIAVRG